MVEGAAAHPGGVSLGKRMADHVDRTPRVPRSRGPRSDLVTNPHCRVILAGIEVRHPDGILCRIAIGEGCLRLSDGTIEVLQSSHHGVIPSFEAVQQRANGGRSSMASVIASKVDKFQCVPG